jgi:hypothetical protein
LFSFSLVIPVSFPGKGGWLERGNGEREKRRYGEGVVYSPILRFAGSPIRGLSVTAEDVESGEALVWPLEELLLWALPSPLASEKESYREYSV